MLTPPENIEKLRQLTHDGFCVVESVLPTEMVERLRVITDQMLAQQDDAHFEAQRSTGSMIPVSQHPFLAELIAHPAALAALAGLGFDDPRWLAGFVISKPPRGPQLRWHQDGLLWAHPVSYTTQPQQFFLMYYLVDTTPENGCLRVIPGSHRKRHPLHGVLDGVDGREINRMADPDHVAFKPAAGEVDVPVRAGDVVIGDARLYHAAHANSSDERRTNITLWYLPAFTELPEPVRSFFADQAEGEQWSWSEPAQSLVEPLRPTYEGAAEPIELSRVPGKDLD